MSDWHLLNIDSIRGGWKLNFEIDYGCISIRLIQINYLWVIPAATDDMQSWDRGEPKSGLAPRPEHLQKNTIVPDRPWSKTGKSPA